MSTKKKEVKGEKFVGDKKVVSAIIIKEMTPGKSEMIEVSFDDGTSVKMPKARYEIMATDAATDLTKVREMVTKEVGERVYAIMMEYGLQLDEIDATSQRVFKMVNDALLIADNTLWGVSQPERRTLIDINKVLIKKYESVGEENNDESAS